MFYSSFNYPNVNPLLFFTSLLIGYEYLTFEPALERTSTVHYSHDNEEVLSGINHVEDELKLLMEKMKQQEELFYKMSSKVEEKDEEKIEEKDEPDDLTVMTLEPEYNDVITEKINPKIQPIDTKPWKSISLKNRVGQFGRDSCEKVEKVRE